MRKVATPSMFEAQYAAPWLRRPDPELLARAESNLSVLGVRTTKGEPTRNHAKLAVADDTTFYIGSQNLYPGGMAGPIWTQLAEYGYIVDDPEKARELVAQYWNPMWQRARPSDK
jgi:phosphatidylserine/phosphatidylglycerophosphate/cardiolipin synthase-like enzyme